MFWSKMPLRKKLFPIFSKEKREKSLKKLKEKKSVTECLDSNEEDISVEERKWMFQFRFNDLDIRGKRKWKYSNLSGLSCS